ncbi:MAG: L-threonylcarbamoyladenylate synthase [Candidatus Altarchaeaceae archaeon]
MIVTSDVNLGVKFLNLGKVIIYPTDTVYGIGCRINFSDSIKRIFEIKKRKFDKPLSVAFHDLNQLKEFVILNEKQENFIKEHLNLPYTFIVEKNPEKISDIITGNKNFVGVRIINHEIVRELTKEYPIITTSANLSGKPPAKSFEEIDNEIAEKVDLILKGECKHKKPSTVIDLIKFKIIRE